jgi:hypothetical protein
MWWRVKSGSSSLFLLVLLFGPEDRGSNLLLNVGEAPNYTASHPRRK